ncbi:dephospho-CoA kinase [Halomonas sp. NCCP-2165]|nr:dephospho-CoA kinase [Halomonas sp. NCCP-2165]GKW49284.1 dephospho-CoA kinase [Halomonas sp. NCCP-2165]
MSLTIGVTGGIASGKSTVARAFAALGIPWVDADDIAREVVEPGEPALAAIAERYGARVLDDAGGLNRRALREIVFADPEERRWLESQTHPRIRERLEARLAAMAAGSAPYHLLVSPLLLESGQATLVDRVLVIDVPEAEQVRRTASRDGVDETQARAIIAAQLDRRARLARADDIIDNSGDEAALTRQVEALDRRFRRLAEARR